MVGELSPSTILQYGPGVCAKRRLNIGQRRYNLWVNEAMNEIELSLLNHKRNRRDGSHLCNIFVQDVCHNGIHVAQVGEILSCNVQLLIVMLFQCQLRRCELDKP